MANLNEPIGRVERPDNFEPPAGNGSNGEAVIPPSAAHRSPKDERSSETSAAKSNPDAAASESTSLSKANADRVEGEHRETQQDEDARGETSAEKDNVPASGSKRLLAWTVAAVILFGAAGTAWYFTHRPVANNAIITSSGRIESEESHIAALTAGRVSAVFVKEGESVKKGQELVALDDQILAPSIKEANEGVELAEQMLAKAKSQVTALNQSIAQMASQAAPSAKTGIHSSKNTGLAAGSKQLSNAEAKTAGGTAQNVEPASSDNTQTNQVAQELDGKSSSASGDANVNDQKASIPLASSSVVIPSQRSEGGDNSVSTPAKATAEANGNGAPGVNGVNASTGTNGANPLTGTSGANSTSGTQGTKGAGTTGSKAVHLLTAPVRMLFKPLSALSPSHIIRKELATAQANAMKMQASMLGQVQQAQGNAAKQVTGIKQQLAQAQAGAMKMQMEAAQKQGKAMHEMMAKMQSKMQAQAAEMKAQAGHMQSLMQEQASAIKTDANKMQARSMQFMLAQASSQVLAAQAAVTKARGLRDQLQKKNNEFVVKSPIDGVCTLSAVQPGDVVSAGRVLLTVADPQKTYMRGFIPEGQIASVKVGQKAMVSLDSSENKGGHQLPAHVTAIDPAASFTPENVYFKDDRVKQVFGLKLTIDKPDGSAKPGLACAAEINTQQAGN